MATAPDLTRPLLLDMAAFEADENAPRLRTDLRVPFADGVYRFFIDDHQVTMIENRFLLNTRQMLHRFPGDDNLGLGTIYSRLCRGRSLFKNGAPIMAGMGAFDPAEAMFFRSDIELVIGWALVGGGDVSREQAADLLERYVKDQPIAPLWTLAFAIVATRLFGREANSEDGE